MTEQNLYFDIINERFSLPVNLLKKFKDGSEAFGEMVVLSAFDLGKAKQQAHADAVKQFGGKEPTKDVFLDHFNDLFDQEYSARVIAEATRVPGNLDKKVFINKDWVLQNYTMHELGTLYNAYITVTLNQPHLKHLSTDTEADVETIMNTIEKHATATETAFFLNGLTTLNAAQLIKCLVEQVRNLQMQNGSSGSQ